MKNPKIDEPMKTSNIVVWLSWLIVVLALVAALAGLFWQAGGGPFSFTTLRGETVQTVGQSLWAGAGVNLV
jgi:hypothetical protein